MFVTHNANGCLKINSCQVEALIFPAASGNGCRDKRCIMRNNTNSENDRRHFIAEWAERRGVRQADIVRELGADKGAVSRWFADDIIPTEKYLKPLADYLGVDEVIDLFRHPDDDWLKKMFHDKTEEQREAAIEMLKIFFRNSAGRDDDERRRTK